MTDRISAAVDALRDARSETVRQLGELQGRLDAIDTALAALDPGVAGAPSAPAQAPSGTTCSHCGKRCASAHGVFVHQRRSGCGRDDLAERAGKDDERPRVVVDVDTARSLIEELGR